MKHLKDAETHIERAMHGKADLVQFNALLAIAHALIAGVEQMGKSTLAITQALIAIVERLPQPAEAWSKCTARLQKEERGRENAKIQIDNSVQGADISGAHIIGDKDEL